MSSAQFSVIHNHSLEQSKDLHSLSPSRGVYKHIGVKVPTKAVKLDALNPNFLSKKKIPRVLPIN